MPVGNAFADVFTICGTVAELSGSPVRRVVKSCDEGVLTVQDIVSVFTSVRGQNFGDRDSIVTVSAFSLQDANLGALVAAMDNDARKGAQEKRNYFVKRSDTRFCHRSNSWT
jgi:hypothetical protein